MYKICQTEQSLRRQRALEKGLLSLMLKSRYDDISVSDLCNALQIPRKAFYRYFSSKDGALFALIDHTLAEFFEMPDEKNKQHGTAVGDLDLFFLFWYQQKPLLDALQRSALSGVLVERAYVFSLRERHIPEHIRVLTDDVQSAAMAFSVCGLMSMVLEWHRQNYLISADEMASLAIHMLTQPLLKLHK